LKVTQQSQAKQPS